MVDEAKRALIREETTADAVSYLPSRVGMIRSYMRGLPKDLDIEVVESSGGHSVCFSDLTVHVPSQHWEDFNVNLFGGELKVGSNPLPVFEASGSLRDLRQEVRLGLQRLFTSGVVETIERAVESFRGQVGSNKDNTPDNVVVKLENKDFDVDELLDMVIESYGQDLGELQILSEALDSGESIQQFDVFSDYDFLFGSRVFGDLGKVSVVLESSVDFGFAALQSLAISDKDAVDEVEEATGNRVVGNVVYPNNGSVFSIQEFRNIRESLEKDQDEE